MFGKYDADRLFSQYGFNQKQKNDETIINTAKAFASNEYIGSSRNRLNSGILRNQFLLLLDSLNGKPLSNQTFSGVTQLRTDQYVLVHQNRESDLWEVYQGNSPNNPRKIYDAITLKSFFDSIQEVVDTTINDVKKDDSGTDNGLGSSLPNFTPSQIIYYGVPGCGKSYEVNKVINDELDKYVVTDKEYHKVRCVFHPEYCNADFVGQIYPYAKPDNGGVEYRFKPGPFAEIVRRAYRNPAEPFFLIIEEINRGNAAAIFGEIFQLLDRIRPEDGPEELSGNIYDTGWSSYGVTNIDVNAYVRQKSTDNPEKIEYDDSIPYGDKIKFINNTAIRLPPNLSIYATMNTSDQNVFTMDNAFQRRFKSKMIRNSLDNTAQFDLKIGDTDVRWGDFREWINEKILAPETGLKKAEDKCLGGWFIKGEKKTDQNGKVSNESKDFPKDEFAEKVLKYLWNDVFKRSAAENIFLKGKVSSLTNLIELFESGEKFAAFENVFVINAADKAKLLSQKNNP